MIESLNPIAMWVIRIAVCAVIGGVIWLLLYVSLAWSVYAVSCHATGIRAYWRGLLRHPALAIGIAWPVVVGLVIGTGELPMLWAGVIAWLLFCAPVWALILMTVKRGGEA